MAWKLKLYFTDGDSYLVDNDFDMEEDAREELNSWLENWSVGAESLQDDDEYVDPDNEIEGFEIWEEWMMSKCFQEKEKHQ